MAAAVLDNAVVTFETSTLTPDLEDIFCNIVAGEAAIDFSRSQINAINKGGRMSPRDLKEWGRDKRDFALRQLYAFTGLAQTMRYPTR